MATGLTGLKKLQLGKETTPGTAVPATSIFMGGQIKGRIGDRKIEQPLDERGSLSAAHRSGTVSEDWSDQLSGNVTFEDVPYLLEMAVVGGVSPTSVDSTALKYVYAPSLSAANAPKTYTFEFGNNAQAFQVPFGFIENLEFHGGIDSFITFTAGIVGQSASTTSFTGALAARTVEDAISDKTTVAWDDTGGTIGATVVSNTLLDWTWKLPKHFNRKRYQDGAITISGYGEERMQPELDLTFEVNSSMLGKITKYTGETRALIRLLCVGSLAGVTQKKTFQIDGAYKVTDIAEISDHNGVSTVQLKLMGEYDATYAKLFEIWAINKVAALP